MLFIGMDLGTSAGKLLLMNENGEVYKTVSKQYAVSFPQRGWAEQNPEIWFQNIIEGLKELTANQEKDKIAGIGLSGQMHGLVLLDKKGKVIRPAILWNDGRAEEETDYLNREIGKERLAQYTGNIAFTGFTASKIRWLKKHEPENFSKICKIMLPKDYITFRLTGVFCTDFSDASGTLLFDVKNKRWSKEMMRICGISETMLPKPVESWEIVGELTKEICRELEISGTIKVVAGAGDNAAAAIGTGTVGNNRCNISLGTGGTIFISSDTFRMDEGYVLHSFAHADGKYHLMGCMLSAASCNKWWMESVLETENYGKEQKGIRHLGENKVMYLPYLMGERCPHNDPNARAAFVGMDMNTSRKEMTLAVMEGVAFGLRDSLEAARMTGVMPKRASICGGGAKSFLWRRIMANVMGMELDSMEQEEGPAYGAAILAATGCGRYANIKEAAEKLTKVKCTVVPETKLVDRYESQYIRFKELYPALKQFFDRKKWQGA
ncbi:MAG: xylulokinase [Clostridiales bacterium]|nr:xylulokinase [Clostridiales bacterium]